MIGNTVIKSTQKLSVIQQSSTYLSNKYKIDTVKIENEENTISRIKEESSNEQQYIPSTSGSGMQIITHIPHFISHAHSGLCMMAMKFQTIARL